MQEKFSPARMMDHQDAFGAIVCRLQLIKGATVLLAWRIEVDVAKESIICPVHCLQTSRRGHLLKMSEGSVRQTGSCEDELRL